MGNNASRLYRHTTVTPRKRLINCLNGIVVELKDINANDEEAQTKCLLSILLQQNYIEFRFLDEGYTNWCKVCLCFQVVKECLEPFTLGKAEEIYEILKTNIQKKQLTCTCSDLGKEVRDTESSKKDLKKCCVECKAWVTAIEQQTQKVQALVWDNTKLSKAKSDPWALVKVYLPVGCKYHSGPADADAVALLTFIERCQVFIGHININNVKEVREIRNKVFHSPTMKLDSDELSKYKGKITDLLLDKDTNLSERHRCIKEIERICGHKTVIGKKEEHMNFKAIARVLEETQSALTERLDKGISDDNFEETVNDITQIQQECNKMLSFVKFNAIDDTEFKSALETTVDTNKGAVKKLIDQQYEKQLKEEMEHQFTSDRVERANLLLLGPSYPFLRSVISIICQDDASFLSYERMFSMWYDDGSYAPRTSMLKNVRLIRRKGLGYGTDDAKPDDVSYMVNGHVDWDYMFSGPISVDNPRFIREPKEKDKMHCVIHVMDAEELDSDRDATVKKNLNQIRDRLTDLGVPQVMVLTGINKLCRQVYVDITNIYRSVKVKEMVIKASETFKLPRDSIFPVQNYNDRETKLDYRQNIPILLALRNSLSLADDFLKKQEGVALDED